MSMLQATLHGYLGSDPETHDGKGDSTFTTFSIAHTVGRGKDSEETLWIDVIAFGKLGEIIAEHFNKGSEIIVTGPVSLGKVFQRKNGEWDRSISLNAREFDFCGKKGDGEGSSTGSGKAKSDDLPF